jgi:class 3 adenylate cyclase/tetratricopeptide (TPR) repeat protein
MTVAVALHSPDRLRPYVAGLAVDWLQTTPDVRHRCIDGSLAFVDISGFTTLTERLAAKGKVGAEEMSDLLNASFATLLEEAYAYGALLVKWGGDAVLLLFEGPDHALLASRAAFEMRRTMRRIGRLQTSVGVVQLKMSVGVDSGSFDFFMTGRRHRELLVAGPAATATAVMEQTAEAGEIVVSPATAALLPGRCVGEAKGDGFLLRSAPPVDPRCRYWPRLQEAFDFGSCLDPAIRDHLLAEVGDSEHRQIAVGFVEISGVDDLLVRQGPGAVASALHDLIVLVQNECDHHRVTFWETDISKDGFKIMLVAGAPRSTGHDEDGMLRATRAILDAHSGPIKVRIGVNSGRVFNGGFGPSFRRTWSVKGDAINLAARVMGKAADGQLLATEGLLRRVTSRVEADLLPAFMVKGKKHPVRAAVVRRVRSDKAVDTARAGAFIGRRPQVDMLLGAVAAAAGGSGGAMAVTGAAGSGKSRLVDHVCRRIGQHTVVLRAFGDDYESSTAYYTVRRLLRDSLGLPMDADEGLVHRTLQERVSERVPQLQPWLPLLSVPFGLDLPDTPETAAVQGQFRRGRTASLVVEFLTAVVDAPLVAVIDDVHSADDASAELLARLAAEAQTRSWLLLMAGRQLPDALRSEPAVRDVEIPPLSVEESHELVLDTPGGDTLPPHAMRVIVDRAEGSPLFLQELTTAALSADGDELPSSLEDLLAAQIDDLAPQERGLLRAVSVLGNRFDEQIAAAMLDESPQPGQWQALDRFLAKHADGTRRFRTTLVRDAAYEGLPFSRRVELHGRAASALERRAGISAADHAEALSLHCLAARRYADAWAYSRTAAERARRVYANAEALTFYRRAKVATRYLPEVSATDNAELNEAIGDVCSRLTELDSAMEAYREARRRAPRTEPLLRGRIAMNLGLCADAAGAVRQAVRWLSTAQRDLAVPLAPDLLREAGALQARIRVERAYLLFISGRQREAAALCRQAIDEGERAEADAVVGRALHLLDLLDLYSGAAEDEQQVLRALELFERCDDLPRQAGVWNHLGSRSYFSGDWNAAVERYQQSRDIHLRCGDDWSAAISSANIGEILVDQGHLAEARPLLEEALRVWRASATPSYVGFGASLMGRVCAREGRHAEAMALYAEALAAYATKDERFEIVETELRVAEALLLQGAASAATARLEETRVRLAEALSVAGLDKPGAGDADPSTDAGATSTLYRLRGIAAAQLGDRLNARACLERALQGSRSRNATHDAALALHAIAWLDDAADAERAEAAALFAELGIIWMPDMPRRASTDTAAATVTLPRPRRGDVDAEVVSAS